MSPPGQTLRASLPTPERTALTGASLALDHRTHAFRRDLADIALADRVMAAHYARAVLTECAAGRVPMLAEPSVAATPVSELLYGERFELLEVSDGWAWGRSAHDGYVGYASADALVPAGAAATHRVSARLALAFDGPTIKAPVTARLPLGAQLRGTVDGRFLVTPAGHVHLRHVSPLGEPETDPVAVAERFLGAPYGWGGRSDSGIDCSGLVQIALMACGHACPRDSDQQREGVGIPVPTDSPLRRGDLVYFPGHVGLMVDSERLLHANAFWMATVIEPLADVIARLASDHPQPVLAVRRLQAFA